MKELYWTVLNVIAVTFDKSVGYERAIISPSTKLTGVVKVIYKLLYRFIFPIYDTVGEIGAGDKFSSYGLGLHFSIIFPLLSTTCILLIGDYYIVDDGFVIYKK